MKYNKSYFDNHSTKDIEIYKYYKKFLQDSGVSITDKRICDVGCATGAFIESVGSSEKTYGIDISEYAIKECKKRFPSIKRNFVCKNIDTQRVAFREKFDIITMFDVIEHLNNFANFKVFINSNLKKGGYLVITTPNVNSIPRFLNKGFTGEMDKTHVTLFTPYTLDFFLRRLGFKKVSLVTPYNFYFKSDLITKKLLLGGQIFAIYQKI